MESTFRLNGEQRPWLRLLRGRAGAYALLIAATSVLYLPALGSPSLWDVDEPHNSQCSQAMLETGNWTIPTFNYKLRVDKPPLLYWLQVGAYEAFEVGEFAARLPSALAAILVVLLTFELARRMFDHRTGLLAGLVLASALLFCCSAHFANPDVLLNLCTVLTFLLFWRASERANSFWPALLGLSTALGFLAKGPVALVLPTAVIGLYLLWTRQLRQLLSLRLLAGAVLFIVVALPWFAIVGAETHGEYLRGFFLTHNLSRFTAAMEGHRGAAFYHVFSLLLGFLPWSVFFLPTVWYGIQEARLPTEAQYGGPTRAYKFLACWIGVYFVFFSISQTKLPNYILPLYPSVAIVVGRFLERWRRGAITPPNWVMSGGVAMWACLGAVTIAGLLIASGAVEVGLPPGHRFVGLENCAWIGLVPLAGSAAAWLCLRQQARRGVLVCLAVPAVLFAALLLALGAPAMDGFKAPRELVSEAGAQRDDADVLIACYQWYQPSLVFYCQREVVQLTNLEEVLDQLHNPLTVYLFLPGETWKGLTGRIDVPCRLLARHWDFYRHCEVVVVTNH